MPFSVAQGRLAPRLAASEPPYSIQHSPSEQQQQQQQQPQREKTEKCSVRRNGTITAKTTDHPVTSSVEKPPVFGLHSHSRKSRPGNQLSAQHARTHAAIGHRSFSFSFFFCLFGINLTLLLRV
uniref:Uncharacterized protein n=1 Tax=Knipowitschia caucasica TaxID=637954 RepID=A0AAV2K9Q8_KNICA